MSSQLWISLGTVLLGLVLMTLEMFVPSAGALGVLAVLCLVGGVISSFYYGGLGMGTLFVVGTSIAAGGLLAGLIRWWPHTRLGKLILTTSTPPEELLPDRTGWLDMVGRVGQVRSLMVPGGVVEIDGERFDALSVKPIEPGTWVKVTGVQGRDLLVRPVTNSELGSVSQGNSEASEASGTPFDDPFADGLT